MNIVIPDALRVSPALEALGLALNPLEALALTLALVSMVGSLVYARRHHTGRCTVVTLNERCASEVDAAHGATR